MAYGIGLNPNQYLAYEEKAKDNIEESVLWPYKFKKTVRNSYLNDQNMAGQVAQRQNGFYDQMATRQSMMDNAAIYPELREYADDVALDNARFNATRASDRLDDYGLYRPDIMQLKENNLNRAIQYSNTPVPDFGIEGLPISENEAIIDDSYQSSDMGLMGDAEPLPPQDQSFNARFNEDNAPLAALRDQSFFDLTSMTGLGLDGLQDALQLATTDPEYSSVPGLKDKVMSELNRVASVAVNYPEYENEARAIMADTSDFGDDAASTENYYLD